MTDTDQTLRDFVQESKDALVRTAYVVMTTGVGMSFDPDEEIREEGHMLMTAGLKIKQLLIDTGTTNDEFEELLDAIDREDEKSSTEAQA